MSDPTLPAPVTGFGDIRFWVLRADDDAALNDWTRELAWAVHPVAGSSTTYRQLVHVGPRQATYTIRLDTDEDARALLDLQAAAAPLTLTLPENCATIEGVYEVVHDQGYRRIADVLLVGLEAVRRRVDGDSEWLATFEATA